MTEKGKSSLCPSLVMPAEAGIQVVLDEAPIFESR
jgi:hypothetical protein